MSGPGDLDPADLAAELRQRFFGKYRGVVTEVDAATMRVKAQVAAIGPVDLGWAMPCVPYAGPGVGFCMLPEPMTGVWIEFEAGDLSYPIWVGCYWRSGEVPPDAAEDVKAIFIKAGTFALSDADGALSLEDANGNTVVVSASGVLAQGSAGKIEVAATVKINDGAVEVS